MRPGLTETVVLAGMTVGTLLREYRRTATGEVGVVGGTGRAARQRRGRRGGGRGCLGSRKGTHGHVIGVAACVRLGVVGGHPVLHLVGKLAGDRVGAGLLAVATLLEGVGVEALLLAGRGLRVSADDGGHRHLDARDHTAGAVGDELDVETVTRRQARDHDQTHHPGDVGVEAGRAAQLHVGRVQLLRRHADTEVLDLDQQRRGGAGAEGADRDRGVGRGEVGGVLDQLREQVHEVTRDRALELGVLLGVDVDPGELLDLGGRGTEDVEDRHRATGRVADLAAGENQQGLVVAAHSGGEVVQAEQVREVVGVLLVGLELVDELELTLDQALRTAGEVHEHLVDVRTQLGLLARQADRLDVNRVERVRDVTDLVAARDVQGLHMCIDRALGLVHVGDSLRQVVVGQVVGQATQLAQRRQDRAGRDQTDGEGEDQDAEDEEADDDGVAGRVVLDLLDVVTDLLRGRDDHLLQTTDELRAGGGVLVRGHLDPVHAAAGDHLVDDPVGGRPDRAVGGGLVGRLVEHLTDLVGRLEVVVRGGQAPLGLGAGEFGELLVGEDVGVDHALLLGRRLLAQCLHHDHALGAHRLRGRAHVADRGDLGEDLVVLQGRHLRRDPEEVVHHGRVGQLGLDLGVPLLDLRTQVVDAVQRLLDLDDAVLEVLVVAGVDLLRLGTPGLDRLVGRLLQRPHDDLGHARERTITLEQDVDREVVGVRQCLGDGLGLACFRLG